VYVEKFNIHIHDSARRAALVAPRSRPASLFRVLRASSSSEQESTITRPQ
jgi:hypothetical protein